MQLVCFQLNEKKKHFSLYLVKHVFGLWLHLYQQLSAATKTHEPVVLGCVFGPCLPFTQCGKAQGARVGFEPQNPRLQVMLANHLTEGRIFVWGLWAPSELSLISSSCMERTGDQQHLWPTLKLHSILPIVLYLLWNEKTMLVLHNREFREITSCFKSFYFVTVNFSILMLIPYFLSWDLSP